MFYILRVTRLYIKRTENITYSFFCDYLETKWNFPLLISLKYRTRTIREYIVKKF